MPEPKDIPSEAAPLETLPEVLPPPDVTEQDQRRGRFFARSIRMAAEGLTGKQIDPDTESVAAEACADLSSEVMPLMPKWARVALVLGVVALPVAVTVMQLGEAGQGDD